MKNYLTVVIPAYNEADRIGVMLDDIKSFVKEIPGVIREVIVVDDGSTDGGRTAEVALYYGDRIPLTIIRLARNSGKWAAIHVGMERAKTDAVLILDADGSVSIYEIDKFDMQKVLKYKCAVFGSRFMKGSSVEGKSLLRSIVSQGYRRYAQLMYWYAKRGNDVNDMQCPMKLVFKSRIQRQLMSDRFAGDIELALGFEGPIWNHPVQFVHRTGSKVKGSTAWGMAKETLNIALDYRASNVKVHKCAVHAEVDGRE